MTEVWLRQDDRKCRGKMIVGVVEAVSVVEVNDRDIEAR
jgi:hypothetical protein